MANTFVLDAANVARVAATLVGQDLNLAGLVHRDLAAEFNPGGGNVVKIRVPGAVAASTKGIYDTATALVSDELTEQTIDVTVDQHAYSNVPLSEGSLSLDIQSFSSQVLLPQATAIVKHCERAVASLMQATPETTSIAHDAADPARTLTKIRQTLRSNGVPTGATLRAAVGAGVYAELLDADAIDDNGRVRGFAITESTRLADDEIVGFIPEAFALVARAPLVPSGSSYGASVVEKGFALRHLVNFDSTVAVDRSLVSTFLGTAAMPLPVDNEDGTVSLVANGGAVRVLTSTAVV